MEDSVSGRTTVEDGPYGGDGGDAWTDGDEVHLNGPITAMQIRAGSRIDAIQVRGSFTLRDETM